MQELLSTLLTLSRTFNRTDIACKKLKRNLHSLYSVGMNPNGMNSVSQTVVWKRVIIPTALYGCELWGTLTAIELVMLEQAQRHFARFALNFDKRSPNDSCICNLGLWTIEGLIDKFKLLMFGRLCRAGTETIHKQLFNLRLAQMICGEFEKTSVTYDILKTLMKYDMQSFVEIYTQETFIPDKNGHKSIFPSL